MYLNQERKLYYLNAIKILSSESHSKFDRIDSGIQLMLDKINKGENIQSIFSKYQPANNQFGDSESYLELAFTKKIKFQLNKTLTDICDLFSISEEIECSHIHLEPIYPNPAYDPVSKAIWKNDNHYFNIHHFRIEFICSNSDEHIRFWQYAVNRLSIL